MIGGFSCCGSFVEEIDEGGGTEKLTDVGGGADFIVCPKVDGGA